MKAMDFLNAWVPTEGQLKEKVEIPYIEGRVLIDGKIVKSGYARKPVLSPCAYKKSDGQIAYPEIGQTPQVDAELVMSAVDAASRAWSRGQGDWATARMADRIAAITSVRDLLLKERTSIATLLMWEIAKSKADSFAEFDRTISYIDETIEEVKNLERDCGRFQFAGGIMAQIRRTPLGVTLCMGPFNYPFNETFTTLIPALIMGNAVVVKVPRYGQLLWDVLLEPFQKCFPAGVVNIINGLGRQILAPAIRSGKIDVLAFIGSSKVANQIKLSHPEPHRFRSILGLDAKNPAILLEDCNLEQATSECVRGALSFNGQRCTALKILFVQESISSAFIRQFVEKVDALKAGMPWDEGVSITPLAEPSKPRQLKQWTQEALQGGAKLCNPKMGGQTAGSLFFPAVLQNVPLDSTLACEEQFGPVVPIVSFRDIKEVQDYVTHSPFGSQMSIFGQDPCLLGALIDRFSNQVCRINLNAQCQRGPDVFPFTGRKASAEGTLSVFDALRSFSIRTMVAAKQDESGKRIIKGILDEDASRFLTTNILL